MPTATATTTATATKRGHTTAVRGGHTNTRRPLPPLSEDVKVKPFFLDDSSEGVEDFRDWSYFRKNATRVIIVGHTSAWSASFADKVRNQRFYEMDAPLVVRKKKTPKELEKEQEERQKRAKLQLMKWMESGAEKDKDPKRSKMKKGATFIQIARSMSRLDSNSDLERSTQGKKSGGGRGAGRGDGSGSDSESDLDRSSHNGKHQAVARKKDSIVAALSDETSGKGT